MPKTDTGLLGDKGENYLSTIANNAGLRAIDPKPDIVGVDRCLVWVKPGEMVLAKGESYDTKGGGRRASVQVKATENNNGVANVKLSAIKHLVDLNEPAFLMIAKYDSTDTPIISFIHITDKVIDRILKALRNCQKKGKQPHKTNILFRQSMGDIIQAKDIKTYLETVIPDDMDAYAKQKIEYRKSTGYDDFRYIANVFLKAETAQSLTDALMGRKPLNIVTADHYENRFDISLPCESPFGNSAEITLYPPSLGKWSVVTTGTEDVTLIGDVKSNFAPGMPTEIIEAEWTTDLCKINVTFGHFNFSLDVPSMYDEKHLPSVILKSMKFMQNIFDGGTLLVSSESDVPVFTTSKSDISTRNISFDVKYWTDILQAVQYIWAKAGIEEYPISLNDLNADDISTASVLMNPSVMEQVKAGRIEIERLEPSYDDVLVAADSVGHVISIAIAEKRIAMCSVFDVSSEVTEDNIKYTTKALKNVTVKPLRLGSEKDDFEDFYEDSTSNFTANFWLKSYDNDFSKNLPIKLSALYRPKQDTQL